MIVFIPHRSNLNSFFSKQVDLNYKYFISTAIYMLLLCGYANEGSNRETKGSVYNTQRDFSTTNLVKRVRIIR